MARIAALLASVALVLAAVGCSRKDTAVDMRQPQGASTVRSALLIAAPESGSAIESPVTVEGTIDAADDASLAAVVYARDAERNLVWRGNALLDLDDGRFSGVVTYTLAADASGLIEVMLVDPATGTVLDGQSVPVELKAAP